MGVEVGGTTGRVQASGSTQRRGPRTAIEQRLGKSTTAAWYTSSVPTATFVSACSTRSARHAHHLTESAPAGVVQPVGAGSMHDPSMRAPALARQVHGMSGLTCDVCTCRARPSPVSRQRSLGPTRDGASVGPFRCLAHVRHTGSKLKVWPKIGAGSFSRPACAAFKLGRVPAAVPDHDACLVHVLIVLPIPANRPK